MLWIALSVGFTIISAASLTAFLKWRHYRLQAEILKAQLKEETDAHEKNRAHCKILEEKIFQAHEIEIKFSMLTQQSEELKQNILQNNKNIEEKQQRILELEQIRARLEENLRQQIQQLKDQEQIRADSLKSAKEAMFETGSKVFREEAEQWHLKTNEGMSALKQTVAMLQERLITTEQQTTNIRQALLSPAGAGALGEVSLENTLTNMGLVPEKDFWMQYHIPAGNGEGIKRPDALVKLPHEQWVIIDSKSSKFFLETTENNQQLTAEEKISQIQKSMQNHIRTLSSKSYQQALLRHIRAQKISAENPICITLLFIPSETVLESLRANSPHLLNEALEQEILLVGPSSLLGVLLALKHQIIGHRQQQEYENILNSMKDFMKHFEKMIISANKMEKELFDFVNHFSQFSQLLNKQIHRSEKLKTIGLDFSAGLKNAQARPMKNFQIIEGSGALIEIEKEEPAELESANEPA